MIAPDQQTLDEAARAWRDHARFTRDCLMIRDKTGVSVQLHLSPAQIKLTQAIERQEQQGKPVRIVVLKARQVHFSVGCATHIFKRTAFVAGQQAMVFGDTYKAAKNIWGYFDQFDKSYLPLCNVIRKPELLSRVEPSMTSPGRLKWARDNWIETNTARNVAAGRSYSIRHLHLSEYAFYQDAAPLMTGLLQCVPDDAGTTIIVESTANGLGGAFYELWQKASDPASKSDWAAVFFAWHEHPEYVRPVTGQFDLTREEQDLQARHSLTLHQLAWRRWAIENKCEGSIDRFHQEYPSEPEEAFLTSGRPRFNMISLGRMPIVRDPLIGELERIRVGTREQIQFSPTNERGALRVWKRPVPGALYVIGADPSQGIDVGEEAGSVSDPDYSVAQVLHQDTGEQVACLRGRITPSAFGEYVCALAEWYGMAFLVPEAVDVALVEEILRQQYPLNLIYRRERSPDDRRDARLEQIGFKTTTVSRTQIIGVLDTMIREGSVIIRDPITLAECRSFVYKPNGRAEHQSGCHDDCVLALALACLGIMHAPRDRRRPGDRPEARWPEVPVKYGPEQRRASATDEWRRVRELMR